jgi:hypothetical protein
VKALLRQDLVEREARRTGMRAGDPFLPEPRRFAPAHKLICFDKQEYIKHETNAQHGDGFKSVSETEVS